MARLPSDADLGALPSAQSGRPIATYDITGYARGAAAQAEGLSALGRSIAGAGSDIASGVSRQQKSALASDPVREAAAQARYLIDLKRLRDQVAAETDPDKIQGYQPQFRKVADEAAASFSDPERRDSFLALRLPDIEGNVLALGDKAFDLSRARTTANAETLLADLRQAALDTPDEPARVPFIDAAMGQIAALRGAGHIDDNQAQALHRGWVRDFALGLFRNAPPEQRLAMLGDAPASGRPVITIRPQPKAQSPERAGGIADFLEAETRLELRREAEAELLRERQRKDAFANLERYAVRTAIEDEFRSISESGEPSRELNAERVKAALGEDGLKEWRTRRDDARTIFVSTHDFPTLPNDRIDERLAALPTATDDPRTKAIHDAIKARADALKELRRTDPAQSVASDPAVKDAQQKLKSNDPQSWQALMRARLAAQDAAGIPQSEQSPITPAEAQQAGLTQATTATMSIAAPAAQSFPWLEKLIGGARNIAAGIGTGAAVATGALAGIALLLSTRPAGDNKDDGAPRDTEGNLILNSDRNKTRFQRDLQLATAAASQPPVTPPEPPPHQFIHFFADISAKWRKTRDTREDVLSNFTGLASDELKIVDASLVTLRDRNFSQLVNASQKETAIVVEINGQKIRYEPSMPPNIFAVTTFPNPYSNETGFTLGPSAFKNPEETTKTVLQETYRLATSTIAGTGRADGSTKRETDLAMEFANRTYKILVRK